MNLFVFNFGIYKNLDCLRTLDWYETLNPNRSHIFLFIARQWQRPRNGRLFRWKTPQRLSQTQYSYRWWYNIANVSQKKNWVTAFRLRHQANLQVYDIAHSRNQENLSLTKTIFNTTTTSRRCIAKVNNNLKRTWDIYIHTYIYKFIFLIIVTLTLYQHLKAIRKIGAQKKTTLLKVKKCKASIYWESDNFVVDGGDLCYWSKLERCVRTRKSIISSRHVF